MADTVENGTASLQGPFVVKRIYDAASPDDGYRALVDRLWPRGVSKDKAELDEWAKEIAPSPALRMWFSHEPERFEEFAERYRHELDSNPEVDRMLAIGRDHGRVTLLYGARDPMVNHAVVLREVLNAQLPPTTRPDSAG
jgi:uncharacterized protein YeaO (DUF488 family)